jgi:hypothetical protein
VIPSALQMARLIEFTVAGGEMKLAFIRDREGSLDLNGLLEGTSEFSV